MAKDEKKKIRNTFRNESLERDKFSCQGCGLKSSDPVTGWDLDVHHVTDRTKILNGGYVKENGISLCYECHVKAEEFHSTGIAVTGFHPDDLYKKIGSSYNKACKASEKLK